MEHVGCSAWCKSRGKEKVECAADLLLARKVVTIPVDATVNVTRSVDLTFANSRFVRYVFPVQEDHIAFSSADTFSDFVVRNTLLVVDCWNLLDNFLSKSEVDSLSPAPVGRGDTSREDSGTPAIHTEIKIFGKTCDELVSFLDG